VRSGIGYDIHRLVEERRLFLGGVEIPYFKGLLGHSDGDVVLHSISDAMLGALALGDIGQHFPDTDMRFKGAASGELLREVVRMVSDKGYAINNIDAMIIAEEPKIYPFRQRMVEAISKVTGLSAEDISIKATTNEGVGSIGKGEAIASFAVVTLRKKG
jgi:2-C-methyl-D-erythritol 2,4-cyclodiphosphate synthase